MERTEYKYLVQRQQLEKLRARLLPQFAHDPHSRLGDGRFYTVRSIYFDTADLAYYHEKEAGILRRKKIRVRGYNNTTDPDNNVFLEIKWKYNMVVSKTRAPLRFGDLAPLLANSKIERYIKEADQASASRFLYYVGRFNLSPTVLIGYQREAFFSKFDPNLRLTFDLDLWGVPHPSSEELFKAKGTGAPLGDHFILELKFNGAMPNWLARLLRDFNLERSALSKYALCLEDLQLADSRHRQARLRRHALKPSS